MLFVQDFHSFPGTHGPPLPSETGTTEAVLAFILLCIQNARMPKVYLLQDRETLYFAATNMLFGSFLFVSIFFITLVPRRSRLKLSSTQVNKQSKTLENMDCEKEVNAFKVLRSRCLPHVISHNRSIRIVFSVHTEVMKRKNFTWWLMTILIAKSLFIKIYIYLGSSQLTLKPSENLEYTDKMRSIIRATNNELILPRLVTEKGTCTC